MTRTAANSSQSTACSKHAVTMEPGGPRRRDAGLTSSAVPPQATARPVHAAILAGGLLTTLIMALVSRSAS